MKDEQREKGNRSSEQPDRRELPFELMVEELNDGILVVSLTGEIIYVNPNMARMMGYEREEMIGAQLFDFMDEEWTRRAKENLERRSQGAEEMFDHRWQHKSGRGVWTLVSARPIMNEGGEQWASLVAIQEISERKAMEDALREARDELEARVAERTLELQAANARLQNEVKVRSEAERRAQEANKAKSTFLANMSHELRTPLNAVIGYSELVQEDLELAEGDPSRLSVESISADLAKIQHAGAHLLALINDILDLTKIEAGKMNLHHESFEFSNVVREVVDTVVPTAGRSGTTVELEELFIGPFNGDRTRIKQVLLNIVGNAAKFTRQGEVMVRTEPATVEGREAVRVEVIDTGIGIAKEKLAELFKPFTQADNSTTRTFGGTGLGLTICKRFVEMMGGYIEVESTLGEGTTFAVTIPTTRGGELGADESEVLWGGLEKLESTGAEDTKVLIIDDDPRAHELVRRFLEPDGYRCFSASNAQQGLEKAREVKPDVIVLDVMMPGQDGWSVLSILKGIDELSAIPVVMLTMVDEPRVAYALGASDYLLKPVQREKLVDVLGKYRLRDEPRVMVVEDDKATRELIGRSLARQGWSVTSAVHGAQALELLEDVTPDAMILDLLMPVMDGFELIDRLRADERWRELPVIVLTGKELNGEERKQIEGTVTDIVTKSKYNMEKVLKEVRAATNQDEAK